MIYPTAYFSVLRTALIGAAQAAWVLAEPDRSARIEHSLAIVLDNINQDRKRLTDLGKLAEDRQTVADQDLVTLDGRLTEVAAVVAAQDIPWARPDSYQLNTGDMIKRAVALTFAGKHEFDVQMRERAGFLWRTASGFTHGTPSSRLNLIRLEEIPRHADGSGTGKPDVSLDRIVLATVAPVRMLSKAWELYDRHCQPTTQ